MKNSLIEIKEILISDNSAHNLIVGFDGFIDEIIHVVNTRFDDNNYTRLENITDLAQKILLAAGLSTNIELVTKMTKIGGNGVIMANALAAANQNVHYIGAIGSPDIHPVFYEFAHKCQSITSLCQPGHTDALEFFDGKLMLGKLASLSEINWQNLVDKMGIDNLGNLVNDCRLIALTNWTMLSGMNSLIIGFSELLDKSSAHPYIYIDLADPAKRDHDDIMEVLSLISQLAQNSKVILGMNEKESALIANYLAISENDIVKRAEAVRSQLDLHIAVIHPVKGAAAASASQKLWVDGPYTLSPLISTGAGDNFNAGFCLGLLLDMSLQNALYCGVYTSGYYVRNATSPTHTQLIDWFTEITS